MDNKTKVKAFEPATVFIGTILAVLSAIVPDLNNFYV